MATTLVLDVQGRAWQVDTDELEEARVFWAKIAQENGWYLEPFGVQIFVDENGTITDHVSYLGLRADIAVLV